MKKARCLVLFVLPILSALLISGTSKAKSQFPGKDLNLTKSQAYGDLPLSFEANQGQTASQVRFLSRSSNYTLFLTPREAVFALSEGQSHALNSKRGQRAEEAVLRLWLVNSNPIAELRGGDELPGKSNYLIGKDPAKWHVNVPTFRKVRYESVYPGIDLLYYGTHRTLEYDFVIAPYRDPRQIRLRVAGAGRVTLTADGDLVIHTGAGEVRLRKPTLYQEINGTKHAITGAFALRADREIAFDVGPYDRRHTLVIDPPLVYSTYLGGSGIGGDSANAITADAAGNAYIAGKTRSADFPVTTGVATLATGVIANAFVTKLNPTGSALVYSLFLGGSGPNDNDFATGIAVDSAGDAYITGTTSSADFPTTSGSYRTTLPGGTAGFVTKLNPNASGPMYSTYLGGTSFDQAVAIAVNSAGEAYVTGNASSTDFPTTAGAFQTTSHGFQDAFVTKFNATGNALVYSSYLGGSATDTAEAIAIDSAGNAYVGGATASANFPTTSGAFRTSYGGGSQMGFLSKVNPTGTALAYSTFLGGTSNDNIAGVAVDLSGDAYVTGYASSIDFPTTPGALKTTLTGSDTYVTKFNPAGSALVFSTFIGGPGSTESVWANGIAIDSAGNSYLTGIVQSNDYPVTPGAVQTVPGGANDTFMTELNPTGTALVYSTFLGGNDVDSGNAICVDSSGNVYVAGETASTNFPVTTGAFQTTNNSPLRGNAFITKFTPPTSVSPGVNLSPTSLTFSNQAINTTSAAKSVTLTNDGTADLSVTAVAITSGFAVSGTCISSSPLAPNGTCIENVTFAPTTVGTLTGTLSFTDNAGNSPQSVALTGTGVIPAPTATTTALTASASSAVVGGSVTFTATVTGTSGTPTPTGTVTFKDGSTALGTGTLNSSAVATYATTALAAGTHSITGSYSGDTRNAASTSSGVSVTVWPGPPDFAVALSPASTSVKAGKTATTTVTLSSMNGFGSAITLACSGLPKNSKCTLSSTSVTPGMGGSATSTLTFQTDVKSATTTAARSPQDSAPVNIRGNRTTAVAGLLAIVLLIPLSGSNVRKLRRTLQAIIVIAALSLAAASVTGCGGGPTTPKGTYSIIVTGTSGTVSHTATYSVTVQ